MDVSHCLVLILSLLQPLSVRLQWPLGTVTLPTSFLIFAMYWGLVFEWNEAPKAVSGNTLPAGLTARLPVYLHCPSRRWVLTLLILPLHCPGGV